MLIDSATLLTPQSVIEKLRVAGGTALPVTDPTDGDIFHLIQVDGSNEPGLYWYNTDHWEGFTQEAAAPIYQTIINFKVKRGTSFPVSPAPADGDMFHLSSTYNSNAPGLYWYNTDHWEGFTQANVLPLTGGSLSGALTLHADPATALHAATKQYVDSVAAGLDPKASCRVATTANLPALSGLLTIDSVTTAAGDRVLVKNQTIGSQNGIYVAASGSWSRAADASAGLLNSGAFFFVEEGTVNGDLGFVLTTNNPITVGTTALSFVSFSSLSVYAGAGLTLSGNTISADYSALSTALVNNGLTASGGKINVNYSDVASNVTGAGLTYSGGKVTLDTSALATTLAGTGLTTSSNKLVPDYPSMSTSLAGTGLSASSGSLAVNFTTVASTLAGTGLSASGTTLAVQKSYIPYDIGGYNAGAPGNGATLLMFVVPTGRAFSLPTNMTNSSGKSLTAPTANVTYSILKNGVQFATMTFAAGQNVATFTATATTFSAGDYLTVVAPATADATHADLMWTFVATLTA